MAEIIPTLTPIGLAAIGSCMMALRRKGCMDKELHPFVYFSPEFLASLANYPIVSQGLNKH